MAHLIVFVLDNLAQGPTILEAWQAAGATGVTILESTGLRRLQQIWRDDVPLFPSLRDLEGSQELHQRTFFTVVKDGAIVERIVRATQQVIGDFDKHHSGLLFVVPVSQVLGLDRPVDNVAGRPKHG